MFIKKGNHTYVPVEDLVNVTNFKEIDPENEWQNMPHRFYMLDEDEKPYPVKLHYKGELTENSLFEEADRKVYTLAQINSVDWSDIVLIEDDKITDKQIFNKSIYIYYERDITNSILYTYDEDKEEYIELNNSLSIQDKKNLYIKKEEQFYKIPSLITVDKKTLYYVDQMRNHHPLVLYFEHVDVATANKVLAFLAGATYVLKGKTVKIDEKIYLFALGEDFLDGSLDSWLKMFKG